MKQIRWQITFFSIISFFIGAILIPLSAQAGPQSPPHQKPGGETFMLTSTSQAPAIPQKPKATDGDLDKIKVSWIHIRNANNYQIFRCNTGSIHKCGNALSTVASTSYEDRQVEPGKQFFYRIKACNKTACSDLSDAARGVRAVPAVPAQPRIEPNSTGLQISWKSVPSVNRYQVFRCSNVSASSCGSGFNSNATTYFDSGTQTTNPVISGVTYYYRVKACAQNNCSGLSQETHGKFVIPPPAAPRGLRNMDGFWAVLRGTNASDTSQLTVYRCLSFGNNTCTALPVPSGLTGSGLIDSTAVLGKRYFYRLRRCYASNSCSQLGPATVGQRTPPVMAKPNASDSTYNDRIVISWPAVNGAIRYQISRHNSPRIGGHIGSPPPSMVLSRNATSPYVDNGVEPGKVYYYWMQACANATGLCSWLSPSDPGSRKFKKEIFRFRVPVSVFHVHPNIRFITPMCRIFDSQAQTNATQISRFRVDLPIPATRNLRTTAQIDVTDFNLSPGKSLENAVSYNCTLYVKKQGAPGALLSYSANSTDPATKSIGSMVTTVTGNLPAKVFRRFNGKEGTDIRTAGIYVTAAMQ